MNFFAGEPSGIAQFQNFLADFLTRRLFTSEVKMTDSQRLLAEYLKGSEPAFCELISRYLDLVYSTAIHS